MQKYFNSVELAGLSYTYIGWLRGDEKYKPNSNEIIYMRHGRLGAGWFNSLDIILWNIFLFYKLCINSKNIKILHAVDLDSALSAYIYCRLFRKKMFFDIYDKYTAVRGITGIAGKLLDAIERYIAKHADLTILAGKERNIQLGIDEALPNVIILENVPSAEIPLKQFPSMNGKWRIGYFGVLEPRHRGLEDLLNTAANHADIELHIAGYGGLLDVVKSYSGSFNNIIYHGVLNSQAGLELMADMHVIVGMYYLSVPNHYYASPNKYYEHLMLGRGLLTTKNTTPGNRVCAHGTGWAIAEGIEALIDWCSNLTEEAIVSTGEIAHSVWNARYTDYYQKHYQGIYVTHIQKMLGRKL